MTVPWRGIRQFVHSFLRWLTATKPGRIWLYLTDRLWMSGSSGWVLVADDCYYTCPALMTLLRKIKIGLECPVNDERKNVLNIETSGKRGVTIHGPFPTDREPSALTRIRRIFAACCSRLWGSSRFTGLIWALYCRLQASLTRQIQRLRSAVNSNLL